VSLIAHVIEIAIFAAAYRISTVSEYGYLEGSFSGSIADYLYFSFAAFTTVGFWRHRPFGALAIIGGDGGTHRLCADYVDRFLAVH
jgi:hypothetical protein